MGGLLRPTRVIPLPVAPIVIEVHEGDCGLTALETGVWEAVQPGSAL